MAVLKRTVNSEAKGFTPYAGEDPRPGVYRARLIKGAIREKGTGRLAYNWLYEFEAVKPEHKKYDGYTGFCEILLGEEEWAQAREGAFVKAITGKSNFKNVNVAFTGKESDFKTSGGAPMTAFDGVKIENKIVNIDLRLEKERTVEGKTYPAELRAQGILPWEKPAAGADDDADDDEDYAEDGEDDAAEMEGDESEEDEGDDEGEEMTDEEWEAAKEARRVELKSRAFGLDKLKETLTANGVDIKGMKKPEMVEAIIALEFPDDEGDEETDEIPDDQEIADQEADSEESDEDDEDDEDDEEEDDEEEDDEDDDDTEDLEETLRDEAAGLDRTALKREIKALDEAAGFKKSESDDDLRDRLVALKLASPGF